MGTRASYASESVCLAIWTATTSSPRREAARTIHRISVRSAGLVTRGGGQRENRDTPSGHPTHRQKAGRALQKNWFSPQMISGIHERAEATAQVLLAAAQDAKCWISADLRIGIEDAARLIGMAPGSFKNRLGSGHSLRVYQIGGRGHKRSVRIFDLAQWLESLADADAVD